MRIIQLVSSLGIGGAEKFVVDLSIAQSKLGHKIIVVVLDNAEDVGKDPIYASNLEKKLSDNNIKVVYMGHKARRNPIKIYFKLKSLITEFKPEVVHSHLIWWSIFVSCINKDFVHLFTQHTNIITRKKIHIFFLKHFIDKYVTICDEAFDDALNLFSTKKVCKIVNGVVTGEFTYKNRENDNVLNLVTISRLTEYKNHHIIIDVVNDIKSYYPNNKFRLNIIGDGPLFNKLIAKVTELKLTEHVIFHGSKSNINEILLNNDLYLLPSKKEGFSIALIEALASGIRIIASNVGGNSEILNNGKLGVLISPNDINGLHEALVNCLINKTSCNSKSDVVSKMEELSIETCASNHLKEYNRLLIV
ncbi:glycosyltransferase [Shewanella marina]|uniref:glycosyltransferase n=1 Tax=Shewanella marina TaxID=487319 RepID=UPI000472ED4F|nr:glycosyltransferase [Shewanella marina]